MNKQQTWSGVAHYEVGKNGEITFLGFYMHFDHCGQEYRLNFDRYTCVNRGKIGNFQDIPEGELPALCTTLGVRDRYFDVLKENAYKEIIANNVDKADELLKNNLKYHAEIVKLRD